MSSKSLGCALVWLVMGSAVACAAPSSEVPDPSGGESGADARDDALNDAKAPATPAGTDPGGPGASRVDGTLKFVTYNVGGLADFISSGTPSQTTPQISPKLNAFDLVAVQEDFEFHAELISQLTFQFQVKPGKASFPKIYGDGLAIFSNKPTSNVEHEEWDKCNGTFGSKNDCLAEKGFRHTTITVEAGVEIDVYSLHMDAGRDGDDAKTRDKQAAQLAEYLGKRGDRATIIAGDTNMKQSDEPSLVRLLELTKLRDACRELQCAEPHLHDRVFVKDSAKLHLSVASWRRDKTFVSADGKALSDHDPVAVDVSWTKR